MIIKSIPRNHLLFFTLFFCSSLSFYHCSNPVDPIISELDLQLIGNNSTRINQPQKIVAEVKDAGLRDVWYIWSIDGAADDTTREFIRNCTWSFPDTGVHTVIVSAIDKNKKVALPETLLITVTCAFPVVDINQSDTTIWSGDTITIGPITGDSDGEVAMLQWQFDKDTLWYSSNSSVRKLCWNRLQTGVHVVRIRAIDNDNLVSTVDSAVIHVTAPPCNVRIFEHDTSIMIHQELILHAMVTECKTGISRYIWTVDNFLMPQKHDTLSVQFGLSDTGMHQICLTAIDGDSFPTNIDTLNIVVACKKSQLYFIEKDTGVYAWDPVTLRVMPNDTADTTLVFSFFVDNKLVQKRPHVDSLIFIFPVSDSGRHMITAYTEDKDGVRSSVDTMMITVSPGYPEVVLLKDTVLSIYDTLLLTAETRDTNGSIASYRWTRNGIFSHSGSSSMYLTYKGKTTENIIVTVTDNDSLRVSDTVSVSFNTPPTYQVMVSPRDTVFYSESDSIVQVPFQYLVFDNEQDSVRVTCSVKTGSGTVLSETVFGHYSGNVTLHGSGVYYVTLDFGDTFGNRVSFVDTIKVVQQHTICFAGHSIACGMGGDGVLGGFRAGVLSGLRDGLQPYHVIKAVGPITTPGDMTGYPQDDSSLAIVGSIGKEVHTLLKVAYKTLSADIWVVMLGANAGYSSTELNYTVSIMDTMLARNPQARVYMITSPPFPDDDYTWYTSNYYLKSIYNKGIRDSVAARVSKGFHVSVVEGSLVLTEPDTTFDSTLFVDHVHPNDAGYKRLGDEILRVMRLEANPAIRKELYTKK